MSDPKKWHYSQNDKEHGPISIASLCDLYSASEISNDTLIWSEGMSGWRPLSSCRELAEKLEISLTPPPLPNNGESVSGQSELANNRPNSVKLLSACMGVGVVAAAAEGQFYDIAGGIGYAIGAGLGVLLFTYLFAGIPLLVHYFRKTKRAPYEAKLVWTIFGIISVLGVVGSL